MKRTRKKWTDAEKQYVYKHYPDRLTREIATDRLNGTGFISIDEKNDKKKLEA